ncbi:mitogen-activated kinase kinase kinase kinase 4-like isoform X7 [Labeo rohita]|uniref:non-specific serine/threonine protein kinase n=1 Tax=Labeo rohita TaxID=84645 RepID=A0A498MPJ3_LABRO|nr:mitogen-activated kinase kinase kinase kinase 4-like isoform X7 [Labeo rohita]
MQKQPPAVPPRSEPFSNGSSAAEQSHRPADPQDLTALAKELRAVEDVRPQHKATDYSSSSDDSGTTDDEDDEEVDQDVGEESTSGPEDSRGGSSRLSNGETEAAKTMVVQDEDASSTPCKDSTLVMRQFQRAGPVTVLGSGWKEAPSPSPVEIGQRNCIRGRNPLLPDLLQQSQRSPPSSSSPSSPALSPLSPSDRVPCLAEVKRVLKCCDEVKRVLKCCDEVKRVLKYFNKEKWALKCHDEVKQVLKCHDEVKRVLKCYETPTVPKHKSSSSFTPFIDPRLLQISPSTGSALNNAGYSNDARLQEALRQDASRKGSVVNVNPVNTRPQNDTPEIRKYKKRFNSEILCAALWGVNLLVGTESGLMLLDRSGQGKVYPLISRRRFQQMDVLEGLNVLVTISGKKNKLRVYYLSWLRNKILHNDPEVEKKQGWTTVGDLEGCVHYKVLKYERIKFLVLALKNSVEVYAWAPKPYHKFMAFKSFGDLVHKPLLVDLTVEEGQRLKVIYGSCSGFHAVDVDSGAVYDIYLPTHIQTSIQSHAIIILPNTDGIELLVCYEDEGVYVNTYGRITKDVVLQWGEMPTSVAYIRSNQIMGWGEKAIEIRSVETGHLDGVFMHKRAQRLKFLCERNDKVFFASVRSGGSSQVYFMTLGRTSLLSCCVVVSPEIPDYRVQGEAVIIRFPFLEDAINYRRLRVDNNSTFHIRHTNLRNESRVRSGRDQVMPTKRRILLLPSHPSDSGTYAYIFRTDTFCFTGSITVMIYEAEEPNMTVMPYSARAGEDTEIVCPHLKHFKRSENPKWYKDFQSTALPIGTGQYSINKGIILAIKNISVKDEGFYTCRLSVIFNNTQYNVSRTWRVQVSGSHLVIQCMVSIGNQPAQSTDVTWLVNDQPVENSSLGGRAYQKDKSITGNHLEVQLVIFEILEEDNGTELKCICQNKDQKQEVVTQIKLKDSESLWLVVAAASSCFIVLVCVFAYHLSQRPQKRRDYVLARQSSSI